MGGQLQLGIRFGEREAMDEAIDRFEEMRLALKGVPGSKPPGTSEILQFMEMLLKQSVERSVEILKDLDQPKQSPFLGILLKTRQDQERYRKVREGKKS